MNQNPKPDRFAMVGMKHRGTINLVDGFPNNEPVILVRDRANKYDTNAIEVWHGGRHIAFISKDQNRALAVFMDAKGFPWKSDATRADSVEPPRKALHARVHKGSNKWPLIELIEEQR